MTAQAVHDARVRLFAASLGPTASAKVSGGRVVAYCTLCRSAAFVDRSANNVRDAWRDHEAGVKHTRRAAS